MAGYEKPSFFDVEYAIPSPKLTAGVTAIVTGSANYQGFTLVAGGTVGARAYIYDAINTTSGNLIDLLVATSAQATQSRDIKSRARLGITVAITGVEAEGVIFYAPQG